MATITDNLIPRTRKPLDAPEGIVVHAMGEIVAGTPARRFFEMLGVDAHRLIYPDGAIEQIIPDETMAYHAGQSQLARSGSLNRLSLGVELLVAGDHDIDTLTAALRHPTEPAFTDEQLSALVDCCQDWIDRHPSIQWVLGHEHVSGPWVRDDPKPDPGPWIQWPWLWKQLGAMGTDSGSLDMWL